MSKITVVMIFSTPARIRSSGVIVYSSQGEPQFQIKLVNEVSEILRYRRKPIDVEWLPDASVSGLISVIITTFNRRRLLHEAIKSVYAQDYRPIEVLVIDDGSLDGTDALVKGWKQRNQEEGFFRIHYAWQVNQGPSAARNRGLQLSRGEYIQFLDSDDLLLWNKFSEAVAFFAAEPELDVVYGERANFFQDPTNVKPWGRRHADLEHDPSPAAVAIANVWTPLPLFSRRVLRHAGPWNEGLRSLEDWEYIGRVALHANCAKRVNKVQALCREHEGPRLSVSDWGDEKSVGANATASAALYSLVAGCDSPQRAEALIALARRILSCLRVSVAAGHLWLAREIIATHYPLLLAHIKTRREARFWRSLLILPDWLLGLLFQPVRVIKRR